MIKISEKGATKPFGDGYDAMRKIIYRCVAQATPKQESKSWNAPETDWKNLAKRMKPNGSMQ